MEKPNRSLERLIWGGLLLVIVWILVTFSLSNRRAPSESSGTTLPTIGSVTEFALTNQLGQRVTLEDLRGKVWIANVIFTRCPGPCARMSRQMSELQALLSPEDRNVRLVSLTTDPEFDSPQVLERYANRFDAQPDRWWFITGGKPEVRRLAVDGLKLVVSEKAPEERDVPADLFIHSTLFVVVDPQARLRAVFETQPQVDDSGQATANPDTHWVQTRGRILEAVRRLRAKP